MNKFTLTMYEAILRHYLPSTEAPRTNKFLPLLPKQRAIALPPYRNIGDRILVYTGNDPTDVVRRAKNIGDKLDGSPFQSGAYFAVHRAEVWVHIPKNLSSRRAIGLIGAEPLIETGLRNFPTEISFRISAEMAQQIKKFMETELAPVVTKTMGKRMTFFSYASNDPYQLLNVRSELTRRLDHTGISSFEIDIIQAGGGLIVQANDELVKTPALYGRVAAAVGQHMQALGIRPQTRERVMTIVPPDWS